MIRRYTLLGGFIALLVAALFSLSKAMTPAAPPWAVALEVVAVGSLVGFLAARRDAHDLRRLRKVIDALTGRNLEIRARLSRSGALGDLGRSLDGLAERLSRSAQKKDRRKDRLQTILDAMAEAVMVTDSRGRIDLSNEVLTNWVGFDAEGLSTETPGRTIDE